MGFTTAAAVRDGLVYIGDIDGNFFCLDAKTGEKKWAAKDRRRNRLGGQLLRRHVLFGSQDATLYCLDAKTGEERWKHQIGDQIRCSPTVIRRSLLSGRLRWQAARHRSGQRRRNWLDRNRIPHRQHAGRGGRTDLFRHRRGHVFLRRLETAQSKCGTGKTRSAGLSIRTSAALTPEAVVFGGRDKIVHARNPKTGDGCGILPPRGASIARR